MSEDEIQERMKEYNIRAYEIAEIIMRSVSNYETYEQQLSIASIALDELIVDSAIGLLKYRLSIGLER